jgi:hypothetical protein
MDQVHVRTNNHDVTRSVEGQRGNINHRNQSPKNKFKIIAIAIAGLILLGALVLGGLFLYRSSTGAAIDSSKYQAVFFTNGQVYFGKLQSVNSSYMKLTDIFYLQTQTDDTSKNPQATTDKQSSDVQLVKLGNEVHGPVDEMIISKDQVLFFENLKKDGKVSDSITKYQNQKK